MSRHYVGTVIVDTEFNIESNSISSIEYWKNRYECVLFEFYTIQIATRQVYLTDQLLMQLINVNYAIVSVISDGKWSEAFKMMNFGLALNVHE